MMLQNIAHLIHKMTHNVCHTECVGESFCLYLRHTGFIIMKVWGKCMEQFCLARYPTFYLSFIGAKEKHASCYSYDLLCCWTGSSSQHAFNLWHLHPTRLLLLRTCWFECNTVEPLYKVHLTNLHYPHVYLWIRDSFLCRTVSWVPMMQ